MENNYCGFIEQFTHKEIPGSYQTTILSFEYWKDFYDYLTGEDNPKDLLVTVAIFKIKLKP